MTFHPLAPREPPRGPLSGIGVVVTRPARQAGAFAQKLAALGATPIAWPAIVILPPDDSASLARVHLELDRYDLAFFVSANAAEYGAPAPGRWPARLQAYAPGPGTAEALASVGVPGARVPETSFDSEGLLALPELADVRGRRAIVFRGDGGREHLARTLAARGATVESVSCYRRAAPAGEARGLLDVLREGRAHALTLTSAEGADNLVRAAGDDGRALLARIPAFVPHPRIADRVRALGLDARLTPGGDAGLVAGLLEWALARTTTEED
ncbi:uroporphyrinogen-III synthase [Burkholderiales bacterium]|nr:uroporphyrinogen-III synthase [Burkholderiales bacterium]